MNAPYHPIQTAADVLIMLEQADLPPVRKRDLISAVNRMCSLIGYSPAALRLDVNTLRAKLASIRPAAHGIAPTTFANLRSLFTTAMEWAGIVEGSPTGVGRKDPAWGPLTTALVGNKDLACGLAAFMNWCASAVIAPNSVNDDTVRDFLRWLETKTLYPHPRNLVRRIPSLWSKAQAAVADWPTTELSRISFQPTSPNLRWEDLPEGLRIDAEAYLEARANPNLFDENEDAPARPLAPTTVHQQKEHIRLAASILVRHEVAVDTIGSLATLVECEAMKTVLRHYHLQAQEKPNAFAVGVARTLIHIARYQVKVPAEHLSKLKKIAGKLPTVARDLTAKNKALMAELENEVLRAKLLSLPEALKRNVINGLSGGGRLRFVNAEIAAALELLLIAPLRPENLIDLNWTRNFKEPEGPKGKLVLRIPKDDTKTKRRDLVFEILPELAETIRWYRRKILPLLGGDSNGDLFIVQGGKRKSQETLSQQITETIAKRVGIHMTPHQFRHFAAVFYLEAHPEDFQSVSDLLGHAFAKTTLVYAGSSSRRASRSYGKVVIEQREAAKLKQRPPRRKKRSKRSK